MSIHNIRLTVLIAFVCFAGNAAAQGAAPRASKILNVADGLPQSFISGLVQDAAGFIWIGTRDGLARYDGESFKVFRHLPGDTATLADNVITSLHLDKQKRLWIAFEAGDIDILNTETEALFHFTKDPVYKAAFFKLRTGYSIVEDKGGTIWLLSVKKGLFRCNLNQHTLRYYSDTALGLKDNKIIGIAAKDGHLLLVTDTALITLNDKMQFLSVVPYTFAAPHLYNKTITYKDAQSVLRPTGERVIKDEKRFIIYREAEKEFSVIKLPAYGKAKPIPCMVQDNRGNVFFDHNGDIYVLSTDNKLLLWKPKKDSLALPAISMLIDRSGVLWVGGNGSGVQLYDLRLSRMWGTAYEKNFHNDVLKNVLGVPEKEIKQTALYDMQQYLFRWMADKEKIWLSKSGKDKVKRPEVYYYKNGHLVAPPWHYTDTASANHSNISSLAFNQSGKLWGMDFYLRPVLFDTLTYAVTVYPPIAAANVGPTFTVNGLLIDGEDTFWVSTAVEGLFCYNKRTGKTVHYTYSEAPGSLPTNQLMNMVNDPSDPATIWIGSLGGGLIKFNKITGKCRFYTTHDGLPNNTVYAVMLDANGVLWCSSNKGIFSFHPATGAVRSFTSSDGLPGDEFNRYHFLGLPDGRMAFGGVDGYTVFDPLKIAYDTFQPPIALTGIRINNQPADFGYRTSRLKQSINSLAEITLPYNQNFLTFEFAALQFNNPENLQYRYRLEGVDNDWVYAATANTASYSNLPPGHYLLKINATNTAGKWSNHIKTLSVIIQPPFWKTWWFTAAWAIAAVALIYFLIQQRITSVRKDEQQKARFDREASELKAQALRAQMNPHFIFNCLNSIKALIQEDNKRQAVLYLTTFSKLIRNQLNNAQPEVSLYDELQTCKLYTQLEALRFGAKIDCRFVTDETVDLHSVRVPPLILQPFIENAIWHGVLPKGGGRVTVSVAGQDGTVQCRIEDDGIGREMAGHNRANTASATHDSKGMKLVQDRLGLHNSIAGRGGRIEVLDKRDPQGCATGTLVIVTFKKEA